ncbi:hypothetical protein PR048_022074 [Dryococelus australis]|uniref:Uncharacterized protein n=1 Tax=Dryococelus australis TaxID=614101 RepID=A0ABQ9GZZ5_9NEOP|nr:hypothetical protein PR048_022074 [Dryococelus australis]
MLELHFNPNQIRIHTQNYQRGKHDNRPKCISNERVQAVHKHIRTIDVCQTHYSLRQKPKREYFYNKDEEGKKKGYSRKRSRLHLRIAEAMGDKLKEYNAKIKEGLENVHTIFIDMKQNIPTPKLTCGRAFYLRNIWTYNVCSMDVGYVFMWEVLLKETMMK